MQAIQVGSVVSQRVDLRLQRVMLHRQLRYAVDVVFPQVIELLLIAVKPNDRFPWYNNSCLTAGWRSQQIQIF